MQPRVLAHPNQPFFTFFNRIFCLATALSTAYIPYTTAQVLVNGQTYSNGLAIIDSPQANSQQNAGGNMPISIDVTGNGKLPASAAVPGSGQPTRFDGLEIYLVSSQIKMNMTVSARPQLLTGEAGSSVKHLDWTIPTCIPPGQYNLTFYETSHINEEPYFSITSLPINIDNNQLSAPCSQVVNPLQTQPQASSAPPQNPFLPNSGEQSNLTTGFPSLTPTSSGMTTLLVGSTSPSAPNLITITISAGGALPFDFPPTVTVTPSASPTTFTVVLVSTATVTTTVPGQNSAITTTFATTSTTTAVMNANGDTSGFVPVNVSSTNLPVTIFSLSWVLGIWTFVFMLPHI